MGTIRMNTVLVLCLVLGIAQAAAPKQAIRPEQDAGPDNDGKFHYHYETDEFQATQDGYLKNIDKQHNGEALSGDFSFVSKDDGKQYSISYTADENGYQPRGDHLPTPPPIPPEIQRALEYIAAHPPHPEAEKKPLRRP